MSNFAIDYSYFYHSIEGFVQICLVNFSRLNCYFSQKHFVKLFYSYFISLIVTAVYLINYFIWLNLLYPLNFLLIETTSDFIYLFADLDYLNLVQYFVLLLSRHFA